MREGGPRRSELSCCACCARVGSPREVRRSAMERRNILGGPRTASIFDPGMFPMRAVEPCANAARALSGARRSSINISRLDPRTTCRESYRSKVCAGKVGRRRKHREHARIGTPNFGRVKAIYAPPPARNTHPTPFTLASRPSSPPSTPTFIL